MIKAGILCAEPETADPAAKIARAPSIVSLRPKICASLPLKGRHAADARLYAEATQEKSWPWRSLTIVGAAVPTAPYSRRVSATKSLGVDKNGDARDPVPPVTATRTVRHRRARNACHASSCCCRHPAALWSSVVVHLGQCLHLWAGLRCATSSTLWVWWRRLVESRNLGRRPLCKVGGIRPWDLRLAFRAGSQLHDTDRASAAHASKHSSSDNGI